MKKSADIPPILVTNDVTGDFVMTNQITSVADVSGYSYGSLSRVFLLSGECINSNRPVRELMKDLTGS